MGLDSILLPRRESPQAAAARIRCLLASGDVPAALLALRSQLCDRLNDARRCGDCEELELNLAAVEAVDAAIDLQEAM